MTKEEEIKLFNDRSGFIKHNNISIKEVTENNTILEAILTKDSLNPYGMAHGGLVFALADTSMGILSKVKTGKDAVTVNSQIDYLRPATGEKLTAVAEIIKIGKTIVVLKATIFNEQNKEVAIANSTYYVIEK